MALRIVVCVKQVPDPDVPLSAFKVDEAAKRFITPPGQPPVVNGFDLNATEAALRLRDAAGGGETEITILAAGPSFSMDVIKRPLSMGADRLVLVEDQALTDLDSFATAQVLAAAIQNAGPFDLVLCGRQASDWDNAHVPLILSELLECSCVSLARRVSLDGGEIRVERALPDGYQVVETPLPAVVTVSNELGEARYPTLRNIMAATRKAPVRLALADLGLDAATLAPRTVIERLFVPEHEQHCEIVTGEDDVDAGRKLALRLREEKII